MKKLTLVMILLVGNLLNADYIPYKELKNYTYSMKSGWRASTNANYIILSEQKKDPSVSISKKLYNELSQHSDYKGHLKILEGTNMTTGSKSYEYALILPIKVISSLQHRTMYNGTVYALDVLGKKTCKGTAVIDNVGYTETDGFIWCKANSLKDLLIEE